MSRLRVIFNKIIGWLWRSRLSRPEDIPKKLDTETLAKALQEARFLHNLQVDITSLTPGEIPSLPRRADKS